ncbi:MAG: peptidylprolyl isomerase [Thermodesulfobacteriota bacterium]|nr:peptidylprolyl isomerase [Thermodesulfobacteriota bacterium]
MRTQPLVKLATSKGLIVIELNAEKAPISTENFLKYARDGFYEQTIFHRVIPNFMIQGGGFTTDMAQKKSRDEIKNEADNGLKNSRGTLAMARTQVVDSASSQFFVNLSDNDFLNHQGKTPSDYGYAVFGRIIEGMDVVDEIAKVSTGNNGHHQDVPKEAIVIESVTMTESTDTD